MRKSGLTGDEAYVLAKRGKTTEDPGLLKKEIGLIKSDLSNKITKFYASNQGEVHLTDSDNGKIMDMMIYGKSSQFTTTGKNLANGQNINCFINSVTDTCGIHSNDNGMVIDVSKLTNVSISTRSIQDRYRFACANTVPTFGNPITCYNGANKDGTKDSYTMDTTGYNYLFINATKLENIQVEKGSESTSYEPYTGGQPSPSPDYPQEIKSVVNPTVKVFGANLLKLSFFENNISRGVTIDVVENKIRFHGTIIDTYAYWRLDNQLLIKKGTKVSLYADNYNNHGIFAWLRKADNSTDIQTLNKSQTSITLNEDRYLSEIGIENYTLGDTIDFTTTLAILDNTNQYEPYHEQTVTLPYTLNAILVSSGGNVIINGQQYIADYVNVERGKLVKMVDSSKLDNTQSIVSKTEWLLAEPQEIDLTQEEVQTLKALATYYPTTNISVNSEQLDGYTVFNYPISMANGWNYVKQQLNDNRDYIYDMGTKTHDIDTQAAEAYINSEYAVALTELEV